jgi:hypothetical protein
MVLSMVFNSLFIICFELLEYNFHPHKKDLFEIKIQIHIDMWLDHTSNGFGSTIRIVHGTLFLA